MVQRLEILAVLAKEPVPSLESIQKLTSISPIPENWTPSVDTRGIKHTCGTHTHCKINKFFEIVWEYIKVVKRNTLIVKYRK